MHQTPSPQYWPLLPSIPKSRIDGQRASCKTKSCTMDSWTGGRTDNSQTGCCKRAPVGPAPMHRRELKEENITAATWPGYPPKKQRYTRKNWKLPKSTRWGCHLYTQLWWDERPIVRTETTTLCIRPFDHKSIPLVYLHMLHNIPSLPLSHTAFVPVPHGIFAVDVKWWSQFPGPGFRLLATATNHTSFSH